MPSEPNVLAPILLSRQEAARVLGLGLRTFDRLNAAALLGPSPVRVGGSVRFRFQELQTWAASGNGRLPTRDEWNRQKHEAGGDGSPLPR